MAGNGLSNAKLLYDSGRRLMDQKRFDEAVTDLIKSSEISPHFKTFELIGESLLRLGKCSDAIEPLIKAVQMNQGVRAASLLAEAYILMRNYDKANETVQIALNRDPTNRKALEIQKAVRDLANS